MKNLRATKLAAAITTSLCLAACGGGGDDDPASLETLSISAVDFKDKAAGVGHLQVFEVTNTYSTAREVTAFLNVAAVHTVGHLSTPGASTTEAAFRFFGCGVSPLGGQGFNTLAPGASCQVSVVFYPKEASKAYSESLVIHFRGYPSGLFIVPLTGNSSSVIETADTTCLAGGVYINDLGLCLIV